MRTAITIFIISLSVCLVFLNSPSLLKDQDSQDILFDMGRVLGVSESSAELSISNIDSKKISLPTSRKRETIKEPVKMTDDVLIVPNIYSVAIDEKSEAILFEKNSESVVPIASISKLMTALVARDTISDWEKYYQVKTSDLTNGGRIYLSPGERVKIKDLLYLMLIGSANTATRALVSATGLEEDKFVELMNKKARELGLENAQFVDPIGLSHKNVATPREVAMLLKAAMNTELIQGAVGKKEYQFSNLAGKQKFVKSTNNVLGYRFTSEARALGGKTGYTKSAGYCLTGAFERDEKRKIITVVLGASDSAERFRITRDLADWIYESYEWAN